MGLSGFFSLEGSDIAGFFGASLLGYLAGMLITSGPWGLVIQILVTYHLFLLWLVFRSDRAAGLAMTVAATVATHLACLVLAMLPLVDGHHSSTIFQVFRFGIAGLAVFERGWLFTPLDGLEPNRAPLPAPSPVVQASSGDDFEEWQRHLETLRPGSLRPGVSLRGEYERWLLLRGHRRQTVSADAQRAA